MRGISVISGDKEIRLGEKHIYKITGVHNQHDYVKLHDAHWKLSLREHGYWRELRPKSGVRKKGKEVSFVIGNPGLVGEELLIEAYLYAPEDKAPPGLIVKVLGGEKKITNLQILDTTGNEIKGTLKYGQRFVAKVHTEHMAHEKVKFNLYEDDEPGAGYNKKNKRNLVDTAEVTISKQEVASHVFSLSSDFIKIANKYRDGSSDKTHEYYVTAEYLDERAVSKNIDVTNPEYYEQPRDPFTKPHPAQNPEPVKAKDRDPFMKPKPVKPTEPPKNNSTRRERIVKVDSTGVNSAPEVEISDAMVGTESKNRNNGICECEAKVRAFMMMLRKGEGTQQEDGYTKLFGGSHFNDMSKHPEIRIKYSTAAGAYQIMQYVWWELNGEQVKKDPKTKLFYKTGVYLSWHDWIKEYKVPDFTPLSQDKLCVIILARKRKGIINLIIKNQIKEALEKYGSYEWASLPPGRFGQPTQTMAGALAEYEKWLKLELAGQSRLKLKRGFLKEFKYNCCSEVPQDSPSPPLQTSTGCGGKSNIDLRNKVKWQTQFDPQKWGSLDRQLVACKKTCDDILIKNGLSATSLSRLFQTSIENANHTKLIINVSESQRGVAYLDSELEKGHPVEVGVDHDLGYKVNNNKDHTTDHFIVIVGRGCENDKLYYIFYDVGTKHRDKGASDSNRLYLNTSNYSLKGSSAYHPNKTYTVTQIRKN